MSADVDKTVHEPATDGVIAEDKEQRSQAGQENSSKPLQESSGAVNIPLLNLDGLLPGAPETVAKHNRRNQRNAHDSCNRQCSQDHNGMLNQYENGTGAILNKQRNGLLEAGVFRGKQHGNQDHNQYNHRN